MDKIYKLDLAATVAAMQPGDSVVFTIAGPGMETTKATIYNVASKSEGKFSYQALENSLRLRLTRES